MKTIVTAGALALATPAIAGGVNVYDDGDSKLKLEGKFFTSFTSDKTTNNGLTNAKTLGVAVDRAYFGAKYYFDKNWMARITTDVQLEPGLAKRDNNIFLKYAYLEGKLLGKALVLRLGQSHTPWIDYEQGLWKHRYVAKVFSDQYKFDSSSDLGLGLKGELADGMVNYWLTASNGKGYGAGNAKFNAIDTNARIGLSLMEGLTFDVQYRQGYTGTKSFGVAGTQSKLAQVMLSYGTKKGYRVGLNYLQNKAVNETTFVDTRNKGFAFWAWAKLGSDFGAFGRFEKLTVEKSTAATNQQTTHTVAGVEYTPTKGVTLALAYDMDSDKELGHVIGATQKVSRLGLYSQYKF